MTEPPDAPTAASPGSSTPTASCTPCHGSTRARMRRRTRRRRRVAATAAARPCSATPTTAPSAPRNPPSETPPNARGRAEREIDSTETLGGTDASFTANPGTLLSQSQIDLMLEEETGKKFEELISEVSTSVTDGDIAEPGDSRESRPAPILELFKDRINSIVNNTPARFEVAENPGADSSEKWYESHQFGRITVLIYSEAIKNESKKQRVDINLVKSIVYAENARGHYFGWAKTFEIIGLANTYFPMNVHTEIWKDLDTHGNAASVPRENIRVGVTILKRLSERIVDSTPSKIATLWNNTAAEQVTDFGAYVGRVYRDRLWEN